MRLLVAVVVAGISLLAVGCGQTPIVSRRPLCNLQEKPAAEPRIETECVPTSINSASCSFFANVFIYGAETDEAND